jgi:hypothetical protein
VTPANSPDAVSAKIRSGLRTTSLSAINPRGDSSFAEHVVRVLTPLLGPHTARRALAMICKRAGKEPHDLGPEDLAVAHSTLRPMLRTLIGNDVTVRVLADLGAGEGTP